MKKKLLDPYLLALLALVVGFVVFKLRYLDLPLYWDEAWVYAPAVRAMYQNGISLLPDAMAPELSRGHPLMLHFTCSLWMHLFGTSRSSMHAFALAISAGLLVVTYLLGARIGSRQIGLAAAMLVLVNETFLAQSGLLLPEMMLSLFSVLAIAMYIARKAVAYIGAALCALLTKETAIVVVLSLCAWHLVSAFVTPDPEKKKSPFRWGAITLSPLLLASLFFLYQKLKFGWFFYPEHLSLMTWDVKDIIYKVKFAYRDLFEDQGAVWTTYAFGLIATAAWWKKDWRRSLLVMFLYVTAIKVLFGRWTLPPLPTLAVPLVCCSLIFWLLFIEYRRREPVRGELVCIGFIFTIAFLAFSAVNFLTDRYLLCLIPIAALGMFTFLHSAVSTYHQALFPAMVLLLCALMASQIGGDARIGDTKLSYADAISVDRQLVAYCEKQRLQEKIIHASFMQKVYMTDKDAGYLTGQRAFQHVTEKMTENAPYAIFTSLSSSEQYARRELMGFVLLKRFDSGIAWGEIHHRPAMIEHAAR